MIRVLAQDNVRASRVGLAGLASQSESNLSQRRVQFYTRHLSTGLRS